MRSVQKPCIGCIYYKACGSTTRTEPCMGRVTSREKQREEQQDKELNKKSKKGD